tara:strand:- start:364 stop:507 length:144 start_codon:yes stop_codon:yes gene_type:complete
MKKETLLNIQQSYDALKILKATKLLQWSYSIFIKFKLKAAGRYYEKK